MSAPHLTASLAVDSTVYLSGILARDANGQIEGDIRAQTLQVIEHLRRVLADHDLALCHVVKTTVWLRRAADAAVFNDVYAAAFGPHRPCRSTVVSRMVAPKASIELEAVAYVDRS